MKYGDKVRDKNPQCAHFGAEGKVIGNSPNKVIFIVSNKGKTFKPGDKLAKTKDQMEKVSSLAISDAARAELEKVGALASIGKGIKAIGSKAKKVAKGTAAAVAVGGAGYIAGRTSPDKENKKPYPQNRYFKD